MLTLSGDVIVYVALTPVDMRKSIDSLVVLVADVLKQNPQSGQLYLFCNHARNKVKAVYWDRTGFLLLYKRLERGRFQFPRPSVCGHVEIGAKELQWLLKGFPFHEMMMHPKLQFEDYF